MEPKTNVVLVHGAWADGSSWSKVIPLLLKKGFNVVAAQLPLTSIDDDIAVTKNLLGTQKGPVVLVGHSYGGVVISGAANGVPNVTLSCTSQRSAWTRARALKAWASKDRRQPVPHRFVPTITAFFGSIAKVSRRPLRRMPIPLTRA